MQKFRYFVNPAAPQLRFEKVYLGTYLSHQRHQSATTGDLQLAEDGVKMFFHRFETQAAFVGNLLIAAPIAH